MERRKRYASLKNSEIDGLSRNEIVFAATSWIEGKFAEDWSDMCERINSLPTPCLNLYCADYTAKEILNGGFGQAFFNASRDFIGAAAEGFRALNYPEAADVIENALKIHYDSGNKAAGRSIEDFIAFTSSGEYEDADKAFDSAYDEEKFNSLAYDYIMRYKKYFGD